MTSDSTQVSVMRTSKTTPDFRNSGSSHDPVFFAMVAAFVMIVVGKRSKRVATRKRGSKGRQKSKAALETERLKTKARGSSNLETAPRTGGMMTKMRGGFQNAVGGPDENQKGSFLGKILWTVVLAAAIFFFARGM